MASKTAVAPSRPALRWHGGKWTLAKWVISHFPAHRCYVEPYGGAASVLLQKPRSFSEVYNDLDDDVVALFRVLRNPLQARRLERLLRLTPFARAEYLEVFRPARCRVEKARRLVMRSFMGFAAVSCNTDKVTGFRSNTTRRGTTPAHDWAAWPEQVAALTARLQAVVIERRDAVEVIQRHDGAETLFYADPPYVEDARAGGKGSYRHEMTDDDHRALSEVLRSVAGYVVLSGYPCELYDRELYPDWPRVTKSTHADGARDRTEALWLSPRTWAALRGRQGVMEL